MATITKFIIFLIKVYQKGISPLLGDTCCFYPSCSNYMLQALNRYGFWHGLYLGVRRIARCHPGSECSIDELP